MLQTQKVLSFKKLLRGLGTNWRLRARYNKMMDEDNAVNGDLLPIIIPYSAVPRLMAGTTSVGFVARHDANRLYEPESIYNYNGGPHSFMWPGCTHSNVVMLGMAPAINAGAQLNHPRPDQIASKHTVDLPATCLVSKNGKITNDIEFHESAMPVYPRNRGGGQNSGHDLTRGKWPSKGALDKFEAIVPEYLSACLY